MNAYSQSAAYQAYQTTANYGRVAAADSHGLILMMLSGAAERIVRAKGCIVNRAFAEKAQLIHRVVSIIDELRNSLNMEKGGELAANLDRLYDYMCRQLLNASIENDPKTLDEVSQLLNVVRDAWAEIPKLQATGR